MGILLFSLLLMLPTWGHSNTVALQKAQIVAANWMSTKGWTTDSASVSGIRPIYANGEISVYVVLFSPKGWVMVSASDKTDPILGYSSDSKIDFNNLPSPFEKWVDEMANEIEQTDNSYTPEYAIEEKWKSLSNQNFQQIKPSTAATSVGPLLSSQWSQGKYYNELAPADAASTTGNGHVWIGCIGTAMAQIMKYWEFPTSGTGSHSYTHSEYGTLSANFASSTYEWTSMPNSLSATNTEVEEISYHAAVSVDMDFGAGASSAYLSDCRDAFCTYFKYNTATFVSDKSLWTEDEWKELMYSDLDKGRLILYSGSNSSNTSAHAWVCDGYDGDYFHFNWGWGGTANGNFLLSAITPSSSYNFSYNQSAIFGIEPIKAANLSYSYTEGFESATEGKISLFGHTSISTEETHSGSYSIRLSEESFSSKTYNTASLTFQVPEKGTINFWVKRYTPTTSTKNSQSAKIYSAYSTTSLITLFDGDYNDSGWVNYSADLSAYAGQVVCLQIAQENRDASKDQWLFVDDISIIENDQNLAPNLPSNPSPDSGAVNVSMSPQLTWTGDDPNGDKLTYFIYFSDSYPPTLKSTITEKVYTPGQLNALTTYYWQVLATDGNLNKTGSIWSFTTKPLGPEISTCGVSSITQTTATICGEITDNSATIVSKGIYWGNDSSPDSTDHVVESDSSGNSFYIEITGLQVNTKYYARTYVKSDLETVLGETVSFTTSPDLPVVSLGSVSNIQRHNATIQGTIVTLNDDSVTERGVVWSTINNFEPDSSTVNSETGLWTTTGSFTIKMTNLVGPATIYYRVFAQNRAGAGYSSQGEFQTTNTAPTLDLDFDNSSGSSGTKFKRKFTEQQTGCYIADSDNKIYDSDGDTISYISIKLTNQINDEKEYLYLDSLYQQISVEGNSTDNIVVTKTGKLTNSEWQSILASVEYRNEMDTPGTTTRQVEVLVCDGIDSSAVAYSSISINTVNDAPENLTTPDITPTPQLETMVYAVQGTWGEDPDGCTGTIAYSYQWQMASGNEQNAEDITDIEGATADSLYIGDSLCGKLVRLQETITDNYCGGTNTATASAYSRWYQIGQKGQTAVLYPLNNAMYSNKTLILNGSSSSGLPLTYSSSSTDIATVSSDTVTFTGVGSVYILYYQSGNECYLPTATDSALLTIQKGNQEISFNEPGTHTFDEQAIPLYVSATSGLPVSVASSNPSIVEIENDSIKFTGVGTATLTASQEGNNLYSAATSASKEITITKGLQTITFDELQPTVYGSGSLLLNATSTSGLGVAFESADTSVAVLSENLLTIAGAGETTVTATQPGNGLWNAATPVNQILVVGKAEQSLISALPDTVKSDEGVILAGIKASSGLPVSIVSSNSDVAEIWGDSILIHTKGKVTLTASQNGNNNYQSVQGDFTLVVISGAGLSKFKEPQFSIFPNPAHSTVNISLKNTLEFPVTLSLLNTLGETIEIKKIDKNFTLFHLEKCKAGIYFVVLRTDSQYQIEKLIVK